MENINEPNHDNPGTVKDSFSQELYLKDLVEEKTAQVQFLQAQLEQRIKKQHEVESARMQMTTEMENIRQEKEREITKLHEEIANGQQTIHNKDAQVVYAESQLAELKQQNELLNAALADSNERYETMSGQLQDEQTKLLAAEEKLRTNKQLLQRLYKEFSACMDEEDMSTMVVPLRPAYLNNVAEEYS